MEGKVKFFNKKKGFGFIIGEDEKEYFVHISALSQGTRINDDDSVEFEAAETDKGLQAKNVTLKGGSAAPAKESAGQEAKPEESTEEEIQPLE